MSWGQKGFICPKRTKLTKNNQSLKVKLYTFGRKKIMLVIAPDASSVSFSIHRIKKEDVRNIEKVFCYVV